MYPAAKTLSSQPMLSITYYPLLIKSFFSMLWSAWHKHYQGLEFSAPIQDSMLCCREESWIDTRNCNPCFTSTSGVAHTQSTGSGSHTDGIEFTNAHDDGIHKEQKWIWGWKGPDSTASEWQLQAITILSCPFTFRIYLRPINQF